MLIESNKMAGLNDTKRIRIKDIAEQLGVSTATVSNVIHGKTQKISKRTVEKVQELLETSGYVPNMAAILLAQNSSKIICVILSGNIKYENKMLQDPFISTLVEGISKYLQENGYFMMLREEQDVDMIAKYASMWNMAGLILIGYCLQDFDGLRKRMRIPFLVIDGYTSPNERWSDIMIDNYNGGQQVGKYLYEMGHKRVMYIADNDECCDHDRYQGCYDFFKDKGIIFKQTDFKYVSIDQEKRYAQYELLLTELDDYTVVFCSCDMYAIEFMNYMYEHGIRVPEDISVIGFDDIPVATLVRPKLTTVSQNIRERARLSVELLHNMIMGVSGAKSIILPVDLVIRDSVKKIE